MPDPNTLLTTVEAEVASVIGPAAEGWMRTPNRLFDGLTPRELAQTPEGARVVVAELRRATPVVTHDPRGGSSKRRQRVA